MNQHGVLYTKSRSLKVFWSMVCLLFGLMLGIFWLFPVFESPFHQLIAGINNGWREIRILAPIVLFCALFLVGFQLNTRFFKSKIFYLNLLLYIIVPAVSFFFSENKEFTLGAILPLGISFLFLCCMAILPSFREAQLIFLGVIISGFSLIIWRVSIYGLEIDTYYLRPRAHFGFIHPLYSASLFGLSAIVFVSIFLGHQKRSIGRILGAVVILAIFLYGVNLADSRNILIYIVLSCCGGLLLSLERNKYSFLRNLYLVSGASCIVASLLLAIFFALSKSIYSDSSTVIQDLNHLSSNRLQTVRDFVNKLPDQSSYIFTVYQKYDVLPKRIGFAGIDSVYFSYGYHFGLWGIISFAIIWVWIGYEFLKCRRDFHVLTLLSAGSWLGLSFFFLFDAQGFTVSNLALFLPYAWAVRSLALDQDAGEN